MAFNLSADGVKLAFKLPAFILLLALVSAFAVGVSAYRKSAEQLLLSAEAKLHAVVESREAHMASYLDSISQDLRVIADNHMTIDAIEDFTASYAELGPGAEATLQRLYIDDNPHPTGQKEELDFASDGSRYSEHHGLYHLFFRSLLRERQYYDIFLFDGDGNLVYTVFKELDYATNLNSGKWRDTDLGNAFRAAQAAEQPGAQSFFDFRPYAPSHDAPASFISTPVFDREGAKIGVLVFQMPIGQINGIMQNRAGLGESGETYLVGDDFLMRSDSRFSEESTILGTEVETETARKALAGEHGIEVTPDYRGVPVMSAYRPLDFLGVSYAILAEVDEAEILAPVADMRNFMLLAGLIVALVVSAFGYWVARSVTLPIGAMTRAMLALAEGDKSVAVPATERGDEIGSMAGALQVFKDNAEKVERLTAEQQEQERRNAESMRQKFEGLSSALDEVSQKAVAEITGKTKEMTETAEHMSHSASAVSQQSSAVAAASEEATANVQTVASAAQEMAAAIEEVTRLVVRSSEITNRASDHAESTNATVQSLAQAAEKIGDVIKLISDIAEQTNLLALNATIEAARAGEAGKGFAVVASEVKSLANQTAKATEEIAGQIGSMRDVTGEAVTAIEAIGTTIGEITEIAATISAAVTEQEATVKEIATNAQQVAQGNQEVSSNITKVSAASAESESQAASLRGAAEVISKQTAGLQEELGEIVKSAAA